MYRKGLIVVIALVVVLTAPSVLQAQSDVIPDSWVRPPILKGTVIEIVDGDTLKMETSDGVVTVRLIGIDTPETYGENSPEEFENIPDSPRGRSCLKRYGKEATKAVKPLEGEQVRVYAGAENETWGYYDRFLGYVVTEERHWNRWLVEEGYARIYSADFAGYGKFQPLEQKAQELSNKLWSCAR